MYLCWKEWLGTDRSIVLVRIDPDPQARIIIHHNWSGFLRVVIIFGLEVLPWHKDGALAIVKHVGSLDLAIVEADPRARAWSGLVLVQVAKHLLLLALVHWRKECCAQLKTFNLVRSLVKLCRSIHEAVVADLLKTAIAHHLPIFYLFTHHFIVGV